VVLDGYLMSATEVTFDQFDRFCEETSRKKPDDNTFGRGARPVINVSWHDAIAFCKWLSKKTGEKIHLPSEAQWEKGCRGKEGKDVYGPLHAIAWYRYNSGGMTHPVAGKAANDFGLYDMIGNVWEWCADRYDENYYRSSPRSNPRGPRKGADRVLRGGGFADPELVLNAYVRNGFWGPDFSGAATGFRIVKEVH
jgi:formylglycine-generating enzyme required for sulfatase activity